MKHSMYSGAWSLMTHSTHNRSFWRQVLPGRQTGNQTQNNEERKSRNKTQKQTLRQTAPVTEECACTQTQKI